MQSSWTSLVPPAGTARHRPDWPFISWPRESLDHTCVAARLSQGASWTGAPLSMTLPATARHLPLIFSRPLAVRVHFWPCAALQPAMTTRVPAALELPGSARHLPEIEEITGPAGSIQDWRATPGAACPR